MSSPPPPTTGTASTPEKTEPGKTVLECSETSLPPSPEPPRSTIREALAPKPAKPIPLPQAISKEPPTPLVITLDKNVPLPQPKTITAKQINVPQLPPKQIPMPQSMPKGPPPPVITLDDEIPSTSAPPPNKKRKVDIPITSSTIIIITRPRLPQQLHPTLQVQHQPLPQNQPPPRPQFRPPPVPAASTSTGNKNILNIPQAPPTWTSNGSLLVFAPPQPQADPAAKPKKTCINCSTDVLRGTSLAAIMTTPTKDVSYYEALNFVLERAMLFGNNLFRAMAPLAMKYSETRYLCLPCATIVKNMYLSVKQFREKMAPDSYLAGRFRPGTSPSINNDERSKTAEAARRSNNSKDASSQCLIMDLKKGKDNPKRPGVYAMIQRAMKSMRGRSSVQNSLRRIARTELREFAQKTSLHPQNFRMVLGSFPPDDLIRDEMIQYCPNVLSIFQGLYTGREKVKPTTFNPRIRAAVGIAVYSFTTQCNGFQKFMGQKLYAAGAEKKIYWTMREFGITTSYHTVLSSLDSEMAMIESQAGNEADVANLASLEGELQTEENDTVPLAPDTDADSDGENRSSESTISVEEFEDINSVENELPQTPGSDLSDDLELGNEPD